VIVGGVIPEQDYAALRKAGESCNYSIPPPYQLRCAPGLSCYHENPDLLGGDGTCRFVSNEGQMCGGGDTDLAPICNHGLDCKRDVAMPGRKGKCAKPQAAEAEEEPVFLEEDALVETEAETEVDAEAEAEVDARPAPVLNPNLVKPTIEKGTKGLPEPPKPAPGTRKDKYSKLRPCPKKRGAKPAALIEMEAEAEAEAEAQMEAESEAEMEAEDEPKAAAQDDTKPRKIHVHVTTKSVGAAAQSLQVLENRFDTLHDRMIGRLNKLMSRIERHPDSIEDKVAAYSFGTQPTKP